MGADKKRKGGGEQPKRPDHKTPDAEPQRPRERPDTDHDGLPKQVDPPVPGRTPVQMP
jgi:hypothetical protein